MRNIPRRAYVCNPEDGGRKGEGYVMGDEKSDQGKAPFRRVSG
jgi:hypothetical protein